MVRFGADVYIPEGGSAGPRDSKTLSAMEHRRAERGEFRGDWLSGIVRTTTSPYRVSISPTVSAANLDACHEKFTL